MTAFALLAIVLAATPLPMVFLSPEDLGDANGVMVQAQVPVAGYSLFTKDPDRPKLWYAPVAALPASDAVRIWYQRVNSGETEFADQRVLCVGELKDGKWTLPALSGEALPWAGPNNIRLRRSPHKPTWGGFNVFQIVPVDNGFTMLYWDQPEPPGEAGAMLAVSNDGLNWKKDLRGTVFTEHNDAYSLIAKDDAFILYQTALEAWPDKPYPDNLDKYKRVLCIRHSADLTQWSPQEIFLRPDGQDPPETEFYLLKVFRCAQGYAGLIMKYYADPKTPGKHSAILKHELIVSDDAVHWKRPFRDTDLGFWSYADPFLSEGRMHFVIWKDGGLQTVAYRPLGLTCVTSEAEGTFTTPAFEFPARGIALNCDASGGSIEVQLLDDAGQPVAAANARVGNVIGERVPVKFDVAAVANLAAKPCRLRVTLHAAKLFAIE